MFTNEELKIIDSLVSTEMDKVETIINEKMIDKQIQVPITGLLNDQYFEEVKKHFPKLAKEYELLSNIYNRVGD